MGRGRYPTANVPGDFAADRRTATEATTSASVRARCSCVQEQPTGGVRANGTSRLSCGKAVKREYSRPFGSHPGNPDLF